MSIINISPTFVAFASGELEFFPTSWCQAVVSAHRGTREILKIGSTICSDEASWSSKDLWNCATPWVSWHDFMWAPTRYWEVVPKSQLRGLESFYYTKFFTTWNISMSVSYPSIPMLWSSSPFSAFTGSQSVFREQTGCVGPLHLLLHLWLLFTPGDLWDIMVQGWSS